MIDDSFFTAATWEGEFDIASFDSEEEYLEDAAIRDEYLSDLDGGCIRGLYVVVAKEITRGIALGYRLDYLDEEGIDEVLLYTVDHSPFVFWNDEDDSEIDRCSWSHNRTLRDSWQCFDKYDLADELVDELIARYEGYGDYYFEDIRDVVLYALDNGCFSRLGPDGDSAVAAFASDVPLDDIFI